MADYLSPTTDDELEEVAAELDEVYDRALTKVLDSEPTTTIERARFENARDELVRARRFWREVGSAVGNRPPDSSQLGIVVENGDGTTITSWEG